MKVRQDAWLQENDVQLADIVIRHVKDGSTQLNAFEEASDLLKRTSAACGFRWNAVVRKEYEEQLAAAKQERKEKFRIMQAAKKRSAPFYLAAENDGKPIALSNLSLDIIIAYLYKLQYQTGEMEQHKWKVVANQAQQKIQELTRQLEKLEAENKQIKKDYEQFVTIMNRARKMVAFDSEDDLITPTFVMERNGNLVANPFMQEEG